MGHNINLRKPNNKGECVVKKDLHINSSSRGGRQKTGEGEESKRQV